MNVSLNYGLFSQHRDLNGHAFFDGCAPDPRRLPDERDSVSPAPRFTPSVSPSDELMAAESASSRSPQPPISKIGIVSGGGFYPAPDVARTYFSKLKDSEKRARAPVSGSQKSNFDRSLLPLKSRLIDLINRSPRDWPQQTRFDPREEEKQARAFRLLGRPSGAHSEVNVAPTRSVPLPFFMPRPRAASPAVDPFLAPVFRSIGKALSPLASRHEDSRASATAQALLSSNSKPKTPSMSTPQFVREGTPSPVQSESLESIAPENEYKSPKNESASNNKGASIKLRLKREDAGVGGQKRYSVVHTEVSSKMSGRYFLIPDSDSDDEKASSKQPETVEGKRPCKARVSPTLKLGVIDSSAKSEDDAETESLSGIESESDFSDAGMSCSDSDLPAAKCERREKKSEAFSADLSAGPFDFLQMKKLKMTKPIFDAMLKFDLATCEERVAPVDDDADDDVPLAVLKKRREDAEARVLEDCIERLKGYENGTLDKGHAVNLLKVYKKACRIIDGESCEPKKPKRPHFDYLCMTKLKMTVAIFDEMAKYNFVNAKLRTYTPRNEKAAMKIADENSTAKEKDADKRHKYNLKDRLRRYEAGELPEEPAAKLKKVYALACRTK